MKEWVTEKIDKNQRRRKKERGRGKKESHKNCIHIYNILTTQHFQREYLPVEKRFCTMFEEALRRFPSNNFLEGVKKNFFWRWSQKTLSRLLFLLYVWFSFLDVSIYLHTPEVCCAPHAVRLGHHTDWRTDASIRKKVAPLIVRAEARFTPLDAGALAANLHKISRCKVIVAGPLLLVSCHHYLAWSYAYKTAKKPESSQQTPPSLQDRRSYQLCHCDPYRGRLRKSTRNLLNTEGNGHRWSILQESNRIPPYCNKGFHKYYQRNVNTNIMCNSRLQPQSQ